ncbi:MAG TPA: pyrroline-5-carboxylate reductase [Verrucomicrobia bacterium]|nr:MAG: pyrroline-5-carboxylate reductase [Lentisphaerae bacterium GWF2_57_35]HBA82490.1 pyrroline-5-carboxylate reductase [Verrucomicrobiota bacterium]
MKLEKIVFLGAGNMAEALAKGLMAGGLCPADRIRVTDVSEERLAHFRKEYGIESLTSNVQALHGATVVVLSVKPQVMGALLAEIAPVLDKQTLVISIAAGVPVSRMEAALGEGTRVVRVMPNMPSLVRMSASALCGGHWVGETDFEMAETILRAVGITVRVSETDMDAVTALSGSGPAYVFYLMECMLEAARKLHLDDDVARQLVYATIEGAARLTQETGVEASVLRQRVTSKGGTTAAALDVFEKRGVREALIDAVTAAHDRSRELSKS